MQENFDFPEGKNVLLEQRLKNAEKCLKFLRNQERARNHVLRCERTQDQGSIMCSN